MQHFCAKNVLWTRHGKGEKKNCLLCGNKKKDISSRLELHNVIVDGTKGNETAAADKSTRMSFANRSGQNENCANVENWLANIQASTLSRSTTTHLISQIKHKRAYHWVLWLTVINRNQLTTRAIYQSDFLRAFWIQPTHAHTCQDCLYTGQRLL